MSSRAACPFALALCVLVTASTAAAQTTGPYLAGRFGASAGDGGATVTGAGAVGYMTPRRLGFEVELGIAPGLDLDERGRLPETPTLIFPLPFPVPSLDSTGRLLTFQTNIVAAVTATERVLVSVVGGGGVANLREDVFYRFPEIVIPDFSSLGGFTSVPPGPLPIPEFRTVERRFSRSENALCLNTGGTVEYAWGANLAIGLDARYTHAFFSRGALDLARVAARATWRF